LSHQLPADTEDEVVGFVVTAVDDVILGDVEVTVAVVVVIWFVVVVDVDAVQDAKSIDASMRQVNNNPDSFPFHSYLLDYMETFFGRSPLSNCKNMGISII
jgi:hypothetical protein